MIERVTIEAINNSVHIFLNGVDHLFKSYQSFRDLSGYPFDDTHIIAFEPDRNIYVVERQGPVVVSGIEVEEIQWIINNIDNIVDAARREGSDQQPTITLRDIRNVMLYETDWLVTRHRDERDSMSTPTLSTDSYLKLLDYRKQLRDITNVYVNLEDVVWPSLDI